MTKEQARKLFKKHYCYASHLKEGGKAWEREMQQCAKYKKILMKPKRLPRTVKVGLWELIDIGDKKNLEFWKTWNDRVKKFLANKYGRQMKKYTLMDTIVLADIEWEESK